MPHVTAKYKETSLLLGPDSRVHVKVGTDPSFAFFRVDEAGYTLLKASWAVAGDLVVSDGERTVTFASWVVVKFRPVGTGIWDLLLADQRIWWSYGSMTENFNTYPDDLVYADITEEDFGILNGTQTYADVIAAIHAALEAEGTAPSLPYAPARKPRHLIAKGRPAVWVLQQLLYELRCYITLNTSANTWGIEPLGPYFSGALPSSDFLVTPDENVHLNPAFTRPSGVGAYLPDGERPTGASYVDEYGTTAPVNGAKGTFYARDGHHAEFRTPLDGLKNGTNLATWANEIIDTEVTGWNTTWTDKTYGGWHPVLLSQKAHEVIWSLRAPSTQLSLGPWREGPFTRILTYRPVASLPPDYWAIYAGTPFHPAGWPRERKPFLVHVTKDGGVAGEDGTTCTYTYTLKALDQSVTLAEEVGPTKARLAETTYLYAGEGGSSQIGLAGWSGSNLILLEAFGERPDTTEC